MSASEPEEHLQAPALRVQDALGYLDQVKSKFNDQPVVYNQFLDIMKEFKSQSLDTPGVIAKVSTLFRGHTDLIVGFNTFLPPGYRIEQMPNNNEIRITTLQGVHQSISTQPFSPQQLSQTQQQPAQQLENQQQSQVTQQDHKPNTNSSNVLQQPLNVQQATLQSNVAPQNSGDSIQPPTFQIQTSQLLPANIQLLQQQPKQQVNAKSASSDFPNFNQNARGLHQNSNPPNVVISASQIVSQQAIVTQNSTSKSQTSLQPGSEFGFNHALNYVNKIKHRFSAKPEIYQQFLEILHTYQRDQHATKVPGSKMLLENEVYAQVARLFQNQQDLLEEFSQFLPDASGSATSGGSINYLTRVHQLSPNFSQNIGMRRVMDSPIMMINDEITPSKRQNSRRGPGHPNKASMKRQNNTMSNITYNSVKVRYLSI